MINVFWWLVAGGDGKKVLTFHHINVCLNYSSQLIDERAKSWKPTTHHNRMVAGWFPTDCQPHVDPLHSVPIKTTHITTSILQTGSLIIHADRPITNIGIGSQTSIINLFTHLAAIMKRAHTKGHAVRAYVMCGLHVRVTPMSIIIDPFQHHSPVSSFSESGGHGMSVHRHIIRQNS